MALYKGSVKVSWIGGKQYKVIQVTLLSSWRSNNAQTVTATGVTTTNTVIVSPDPLNIEEYASKKVYCSTQWVNSLAFACEDVPSNDLVVNVVILL